MTRETATWETLSRAQRDAAYNNGAAVSGSAEIVSGWRTASAAYRDHHRFELAVPYGSRERNAWDLLPGDGHGPTLVFIHGGYWQLNSREGFSIMAEGVRAHGWSVAFPGYTLAPDASLTEIADEIKRALDWLVAEGPSRKLAGPIIVAGWSAGGHLAALALDHPGVAAGLSISGIFELGPLRDTYLNEKLQLRDEEVEALSPMRLPAVSKPFAIAYGTAELGALVRQSCDFHAKRAAAHAPGPLIPIAGGHHFSVLEDLRKPGSELVRTLLGLGTAA